MAKDYFQDILPPQVTPQPSPASALASRAQELSSTPAPAPIAVEQPAPERSIRNITITRSRPSYGGELPPVPGAPSRAPRYWLWGVAGLAVVVLAILGLFIFRPTTITVTPRTHVVTFDDSSVFTAYPSDIAATGTIAYSWKSFDEQDTAVVAAKGTTHAERQASGTITVVNDFNTAPVKLVKTTRFATPDGLVFRTPADIVIPGKKGSTPGTVDVMVIADQAGAQYNVGPIDHFTLPGLKGGAMYDHVYARSSAAMAGGFVGDEPAADPAALEAAKADIRSRLEKKIQADIAGLGESGTAFPDLAQVSYQDLPPTVDAEGAHIGQKVHADVPVFSGDSFATAIAQSVSSDVQGSRVSLIAGDGYAAKYSGPTPSVSAPASFSFVLAGSATILWAVDTDALTKALAGHASGAFETIVGGFPSIQEAHARIEPFWNSSFPKDPASIKVVVTPPEGLKTR